MHSFISSKFKMYEPECIESSFVSLNQLHFQYVPFTNLNSFIQEVVHLPLISSLPPPPISSPEKIKIKSELSKTEKCLEKV